MTVNGEPPSIAPLHGGWVCSCCSAFLLQSLVVMTTRALLTSTFKHGESSEHQSYRERNKIASGWSGPVFVVEDVWVPCRHCTGPVDPVVRVPVGSHFYHPQCLRCAICEKPSKAQIFKAMKGYPVCQDCFYRGYTPKLPAIRDRAPSSSPRRSTTTRGSNFTGTMGSLASAPHLSPGRIGCTPKQQQLIDRQTRIQQADANILMLQAPPANSPQSSHQQPVNISTKRL